MNALRSLRLHRLLVLVPLVAAGSACDDVTPCGAGTVAMNGECVATLSPACGPGTRLENAACVPDTGGGAVCGAGTHSENGTCVPDIALSGNASRFFDVNLTEPADIVGIANGPFHESFLSGQNLLFVGAYLPKQGELRLYGGGGAPQADGSFSLDRTTSFDASATLAGGVITTAPFRFQMNAFGAAMPIILLDTTISNAAIAAPEGVSLIASGKLSGVLTPENAKNVYIESANLDMFELLNSIDARPDVDQDGNGTKESWTMSITFSTTPVWLF
jgi:hypothetical protein